MRLSHLQLKLMTSEGVDAPPELVAAARAAIEALRLQNVEVELQVEVETAAAGDNDSAAEQDGDRIPEAPAADHDEL